MTTAYFCTSRFSHARRRPYRLTNGFSKKWENLAQEILKEAEYFVTNTHRMRYPEFREKGLFVGSGVVEAGCKSVIGARLKRSGMFWTVRGANAIIALRCCRINGRFEDYWERDRVA